MPVKEIGILTVRPNRGHRGTIDIKIIVRELIYRLIALIRTEAIGTKPRQSICHFVHAPRHCAQKSAPHSLWLIVVGRTHVEAGRRYQDRHADN
jgi:hypothetical protein